MITAQDIREKTFEKSTFGGYSMNEVDDFLDELAGDLTAAQKESTTLRSKMKVLVDKIEEYRANEDAMHKALVSAQKVAQDIQDQSRAEADELLSNARAEAERLVAEARAEAEAITGSIVQQRQTEELRLQKAQAAAAEYVKKFRMVLEHENAFLDSLENSDFIQDVIVTPAPEEKKANDAPAEEPEAQPEEAPAQTAAEEYTEAFEKAVYGGEDAEEPEADGEDAIPDAEDGDDAPRFRF